MANIILGSMARINHGLRTKYDPSILVEPYQSYQTFIDSLEEHMIKAVYDINNTLDCIITLECQLIDDGSGHPYLPLENAVIYFCQIHDVSLSIYRATNMSFTIDMKRHFNVLYLSSFFHN